MERCSEEGIDSTTLAICPGAGVSPPGQASVRSPTRWGFSSRRADERIFATNKSRCVCPYYYRFQTKMGGWMKEFLHAYNVEILGCFGVLCFYIAVISIQDAIRKGADRIVLAITSL